MRKPEDYIVFPLDVDTREEAERLVRLLKDRVGMFKVGLELFIRFGPEVIEAVKDAGARRIFLDLKLHDIPVTVAKGVAGFADLGIDFATVHCGESRGMLEAAAEAAGDRVTLLGVTVLTSVTGEDIASAGFTKGYAEDIDKLILMRAGMAKEAGFGGVVCSGREAGLIKGALGDFVTMTPGIRPAWEGVARGDQRRVTTPAQAVKNGSDYLVIGRPIRMASDPAAAAERIAEEISEVL